MDLLCNSILLVGKYPLLDSTKDVDLITGFLLFFYNLLIIT